MEEPPSKPSLEERLKETLNRVDEFSKSASQAMRKGFDKTKKRVSETSESIDTNEMMEKTKAGISTINSQLSSVAKKAEVGKRASGLLALMYTVGQRVERLIFWIISFAPYLIPTTIILQSALWVAFLSDGTTSNAIVSEYAENMGENSRLSWIALSIFGAAIAFLLVSNFDSSNEALDSFANSSAFDIIVVLLVVSSILYLFKSYKSLYYLSLAFIGSIVIRMIETDFSELNWFLALLCLLCLFGTFSALSLPFVRNRFSSMDNTLSEGTVIIDQIESSKILSHEFSEPSYLMHPFDDIDWNMDNAPIQPPKRPSRRSEYELYEWVGLLANLVLWPTTLAISMLIGSGYEIDGTALSMEDNSIML